jgi:hypothetical protein
MQASPSTQSLRDAHDSPASPRAFGAVVVSLLPQASPINGSTINIEERNLCTVPPPKV